MRADGIIPDAECLSITMRLLNENVSPAVAHSVLAGGTICYEMLSISKIELPPYLGMLHGDSQGRNLCTPLFSYNPCIIEPPGPSKVKLNELFRTFIAAPF